MTTTPDETMPAEAGQVPLRQRPIPEQLDYFAEKLAAQINPGDVPREAIIAMGATIVGIGAIATELRKQATAASHEELQHERDGAKPKTCAHCQRNLTGASIHTIQSIDVCADIRHCLTRQAEQRVVLRPEYGIRVVYTSTRQAEVAIGPDRDEVETHAAALAARDNVVSAVVLQRLAGDWEELKDGDRG